MNVQTKHIPDIAVCIAVDVYNKGYTNGNNQQPFPYQQLALQYHCAEKVAYAACERAYKRGYIECGVSLRTAWLSEKGKELITYVDTTTHNT